MELAKQAAALQAELVKKQSEAVKDLEGTDQYLVFEALNGHYGIDILDTFEILKPMTVTRLPNVEPEVLGVLNLRGLIIPVIDFSKKFGDNYLQISNLSRIVVCSRADKYAGLLVNRVVEVARIPHGELEGAEIKGISNDYVQGVGRTESNIFLILNLNVLVRKEYRNPLMEN